MRPEVKYINDPSEMSLLRVSRISPSGYPPSEPSAAIVYAVYDGLWVSDVVLFAVMYLITGWAWRAACIDISLTARSRRPNR